MNVEHPTPPHPLQTHTHTQKKKKIVKMSRKGSGLLVKVGYHPLDIYLGQYILQFLVKQLYFAPIRSKNDGA